MIWSTTVRTRSESSPSAMTRISGSVPDLRTRMRPALPSRASASAIALRHRSGGKGGVGVAHAHVLQQLRHRLEGAEGFAGRPAALDHRRQRLQGRHQAVARGGMVDHDEVAGLLAAEIVAVGAHALEHVAVADRRAHEAELALVEIALEAEVGHHRGDDAAADQPAVLRPAIGDGRHELVAVDHLAVLADQHDAVGVAIERDADVGAVHHDTFLQHLRMGRAALGVDVEAVGRHRHRDHLGAQLPQHRRRDLVGGAIGAIDDDLEARQVETTTHRRLHRLDVAAIGVVEPLGAADRPRAGEPDLRRRRDQRLDLGLDRIGELEAVRTEQLDAVVLEGIVRGRDHHADIGAHRPRQEADRRRRHRAQQQHVDADRQEARRYALLDHVAGKPRVLADDDAMAMVAAIEDLARRHADAHGDLGRHWFAVGAAANAVGAEEMT